MELTRKKNCSLSVDKLEWLRVKSDLYRIKSILKGEIIIDVCHGYKHSVALTDSGRVYIWNINIFDKLHNEFIDQSLMEPKILSKFENYKVISISCGAWHSLALNENKQVFSWGDNDCGQLGTGEESGCQDQPKLIERTNNLSIHKISCGYKHSLLLTTDGDIYSCGSNSYSELGFEKIGKTNKILKLKSNYKFADISSHAYRNLSMGLTISGIYLIWGKWGENVIETPQETKFRSFNEILVNVGMKFDFKIDSNIFTKKKLIYNDCRKRQNPENIDRSPDSRLQNSGFPMNFHQNIEGTSNELQGNYFEIFEEIEQISSGSFGTVFKAMNKNDHYYYAIKKIPFKYTEKEKALEEVRMMFDSNSCFVARYYRSWFEHNYYLNEENRNDLNHEEVNAKQKFFDPEKTLLLHIQMELCSKTLKDVIQNDLNYDIPRIIKLIDYFIASELFIEILESVNYLHKIYIIHRDLKPSNILITDGLNGRFVKLCDFGFATFHEYDEQSHSIGLGTQRYMAREIYEKKYDHKVDIYSLGVILQELFNFNINM
jgi:hypothetical protein